MRTQVARSLGLALAATREGGGVAPPLDGIGCGMATARRRGPRSAWFEGMEQIDARARTYICYGI